MRFIKKSSFKKVLPFVPLLLFYVILILFFSHDQLEGDEGRHLAYATNLTNGFYTDIDNPSLRNGPGYPLVIAIPILIKTSYLGIKLLNAFFLFGAVVFFFRTLRFYINRNKALALSYLFGLYPPTLKFMMGILSESFVLLLVCGFVFYFLKLHKEDANKNLHIFLSATLMGVLALTKVIFGYVIITLFLFYLVFLIFKKTKKVRHSLIVLVISFMFCIPYLAYTYSVTGKAFLWGTQGGEMLYWRSSPFAEEQGNWTSMKSVLEDKPEDYFSNKELFKNHGEFLQKLEPLSFIKRDSLFKAKAIENIKNHPEKYLKNTGASAVRLFFNYPYSYTPQKVSALFYILPNMFLIIFMFLAICIAILNFKHLSFQIRFLILTALIFMGGLTLLDGRTRHLTPAIPILFFLIGFTFNQFTQLKIRGLSKTNSPNID